MNEHELIKFLKSRGALTDEVVRVCPIPGGVSADVTLIHTRSGSIVVKQALARLKVADEWCARPDRSANECRALQFVSKFLPSAVPRVLGEDRQRHLLWMEYLGDPFTPWKTQLLQGEVSLSTAERVGQQLALLHSATWNCAVAERQFDTMDDFHALRIEPYLLATGRRHHDLQTWFDEEAARLASTRLALIHGDFSAKNILVGLDRTVILDWEVACFGDPAFDVAFLVNLLYLKSLHLPHARESILAAIAAFGNAYRSSLVAPSVAGYDRRIGQLTLLLMLARIDGKSPAEYLMGEEQEVQRMRVRQFVRRALHDGLTDPRAIDERWRRNLQNEECP